MKTTDASRLAQFVLVDEPPDYRISGSPDANCLRLESRFEAARVDVPRVARLVASNAANSITQVYLRTARVQVETLLLKTDWTRRTTRHREHAA